MKAQIYFGNNNENLIVRIFQCDDSFIADLRLDNRTPEAADLSLHRLGLYRKEKWQKREWGLEARITKR